MDKKKNKQTKTKRKRKRKKNKTKQKTKQNTKQNKKQHKELRLTVKSVLLPGNHVLIRYRDLSLSRMSLQKCISPDTLCDM